MPNSFPIDLIFDAKGIRFALASSEIEDERIRGKMPVKAAEDSHLALRFLLADPSFRSSVDYLHALTQEHRAEIDRVLTDRDRFTDLLEREKNLMGEAGADQEFIDSIADVAMALQEQKLLSPIEPNQIYRSLKELRDQVASIQYQLQEQRELQTPRHRGWRRKIQHTLIGIGGAAMVGLNASALAMTIGLAGPLAAVSGAVGGGLIGHSVTKVLDEKG